MLVIKSVYMIKQTQFQVCEYKRQNSDFYLKGII